MTWVPVQFEHQPAITMERLPVILCILGIICISLTLGCDISTCLKNNHLMIPQSCQGYTQTLQCIKKEYDSCKDNAGKTQIMMGMQYVMRAGVYCGYDMNQLNQMMQAHTGLMTSFWNSTNGMPPPMMMMGGDGPFDMDDGPMDDGPMDDGPFDDGPFDDGPFDDVGDGMGMGMAMGMYPFMTAGGTGGGKDKTASSPGILPAFRKGTMKQITENHDNRDVDSGSVLTAGYFWSVLAIGPILSLYLLHLV